MTTESPGPAAEWEDGQVPITYRCPSCNTDHATDLPAGAKLECPVCGQRVQLPPAPPRARTVLATHSPVNAPPMARKFIPPPLPALTAPERTSSVVDRPLYAAPHFVALVVAL